VGELARSNEALNPFLNLVRIGDGIVTNSDRLTLGDLLGSVQAVALRTQERRKR